MRFYKYLIFWSCCILIYINNKVTQKNEIVYLVMERSSRMETAMDIELFVIQYAL